MKGDKQSRDTIAGGDATQSVAAQDKTKSDPVAVRGANVAGHACDNFGREEQDNQKGRTGP